MLYKPDNNYSNRLWHLIATWDGRTYPHSGRRIILLHCRPLHHWKSTIPPNLCPKHLRVQTSKNKFITVLNISNVQNQDQIQWKVPSKLQRPNVLLAPRFGLGIIFGHTSSYSHSQPTAMFGLNFGFNNIPSKSKSNSIKWLFLIHWLEKCIKAVQHLYQ